MCIEAENVLQQTTWIQYDGNNYVSTVYFARMQKNILLLKLVDLARNTSVESEFFLQHCCEYFNVNFHRINEARKTCLLRYVARAGII